ncbi:hypothetical protein NliqN6_3412 [Naganishia liquefaciens]|uniref:Uncharacterized protein n=1 Tax=Naganishia liquefaciens TaxID=104408 RepID=A0A8H3YEV5_9TREE|nr:hypothetical protein NliqN6_3412 [Naganishia liquefaciens]
MDSRDLFLIDSASELPTSSTSAKMKLAVPLDSKQPPPKLCNPLIPRLQYLTEIPPSPPVDLLPLRLLDQDGMPIVHPLQMKPELLSSGDVEEDTDSPTPPSTRSGCSGEDDQDLAMLSLAQFPAPRPPLALIKRNISAASHDSSNNSSSFCTSSSPLAGTP